MYSSRSVLIRSLAAAALWGFGCSGGTTAPMDIAPQVPNDMGAPVVPMVPGAPRLDTITPPIGITAGGVVMKVTGQEFQPGAIVTFDGIPATQVSVSSSSELSAVLPERLGAFGLVPVVVQNPSGLSANRGDLFSYYATQLNFGQSTSHNPSAGSQARDVVLADLNGDQKVDVVTANGTSNSISILFGDGMGGFATPMTLPTLRNAVGVAVADVNGDGKLDVLALAGFDDKLGVFLGNGAGGFASRKDVVAGAHGTRMVTSDFNGDKKVDVAILASDRFYIQVGDGLGGFGAPLSYFARSDSVAVGDWNGDKSPDLAFGAESVAYISIFLNNGKGAFTAGQQIFNRDGASRSSTAMGPVRSPYLTTTATGSSTWRWPTRISQACCGEMGQAASITGRGSGRGLEPQGRLR